MRARKVGDSAVRTSRLMLPTDANPRGYVHGGVIMRLMDETAGTVAIRHCRKQVVTASIDKMDFFAPVYVGNLLIINSSINHAGKTSMEIGVRIEAEDLITGRIVHTNSSYLVYVALADDGLPTPIPKVIPDTDDEKRRYGDAEERRKRRLQVLNRRSSR